MDRRFSLQRFLLLGACCVLSSTIFAEPAWVSDQFEVMLRTGPSTDNAIQLMMASGTELEVLERDADSGYSRVMTSGGTEGWILSRYLVAEPGAREQLALLAQQLTRVNAEGVSVNSQLASIRDEYNTAAQRITELERDKAVLQEEVTEIRRASASALAIDRQNKDLQQQLTDAEIRVSILEQENEDLGSQTARNWFVTGALVLFGGVLLGLVLPRIKWQKKSRYDSF
jgi:SH3 domain protein